VGSDHDTQPSPSETLRRWWRAVGSSAYPSTPLLICADAGGSSATAYGCGSLSLPACRRDRHPTSMSCHFPPGTSKWNKVEHRLFSAISMNWRGQPLTSYEVIVQLIGANHHAHRAQGPGRTRPGLLPQGHQGHRHRVRSSETQAGPGSFSRRVELPDRPRNFTSYKAVVSPRVILAHALTHRHRQLNPCGGGYSRRCQRDSYRANEYHSLALTSGGASTPGATTLRQLGNGTTTDSSTPVAVVVPGTVTRSRRAGPSSGPHLTELSTHGASTATASWAPPAQTPCAVSFACSKTPVAVNIGGATVKAIAAAGTTAWPCPPTTPSGVGPNNFGQLGDGTTTNRLVRPRSSRVA